VILHVLDTDTLVLFQEGHGQVCRRVLSQPIDELATTAITIKEQLSGWYTLLRRAKGAAQLGHAYQRLVCVGHAAMFAGSGGTR
jgi:tRNA(fMet)-specific endonuclease VapC